MNAMVLMFAITIVLSGFSFADKRLSFLAGTAWLIGSIQFFTPIDVVLMLTGVSVGLFFLIDGAWRYVPD